MVFKTSEVFKSSNVNQSNFEDSANFSDYLKELGLFHDPFLRIRFLLVPKNESCEHIKNDLPSNGYIILKKRMEIEHALFSSDTLLER